ncbi:MAG: putative LPS assembly protein LptD, partial [Gemmatimonadota bacterium]
MTEDERNTVYGSGAEFTSCDLEHPHYTFRARSVKMRDDDVMVARDVTLRFEDVPVFWLPWMVQSMKRDRRSGLLMPEFGLNDIVRNSTGYNRRVSNLGFYWAMNDYMSTKATFEWYSGNWKALEGGLTYRWLRQFLNGNVSVKHYWREQEGLGSSRELTLNTSNSWQPNERTRININGTYATSTDFVQRNSFDPQELNRSIRSTGSINRTFDWGSVNFGADRQQQLGTGQVNTTLPSLSLSLTPITVYSNGEGLELVWNGSGSASRRLRQVADSLPNQQNQETRTAQASHNLSFGNFRLAQSTSWNETVDASKEVPVPTEADS